jgi:hypothetical protein
MSKDKRQKDKLMEQHLEIEELKKELTLMQQKCDSQSADGAAAERAAAVKRDAALAAAAERYADVERAAGIEQAVAAAERARARDAIALSIYQGTKGYMHGSGKWKKIAYELSNMHTQY